jgi:SAM-dependent methyltransferase
VKDFLTEYYTHYWGKEENTWWPGDVTWSNGLYKRIMRDDLRPTDVVLDVGCGAGTNYGERLLSAVSEVHGVELVPAAVEAANKLGIKALVHDLNQALPHQNDTFDVVLCFEVLEHTFDPLFVTREMYRVLKPGGKLLASVPNMGYFRDRLSYLLRAYLNTSGFDPDNVWAGAHIRFFNKRYFGKMLRAAGFTHLQFRSGGTCSIFDLLEVIYLSEPALWLRSKLPGPLRLSFMGAIWPGVWADTLIFRAIKPTTEKTAKDLPGRKEGTGF